jgi:hypothetical protein
VLWLGLVPPAGVEGPASGDEPLVPPPVADVGLVAVGRASAEAPGLAAAEPELPLGA